MTVTTEALKSELVPERRIQRVTRWVAVILSVVPVVVAGFLIWTSEPTSTVTRGEPSYGAAGTTTGTAGTAGLSRSSQIR